MSEQPEDVVTVTAFDDEGGRYVRPDERIGRRVERVLGGAEPVPVRLATGRWRVELPGDNLALELSAGPASSAGVGPAVVADAAVLDTFDIPDPARDALAETGLAVLGERNADVEVTPPGATAVDALVVATDRRVGYYSDLLVTPAFLEARRLPTRVRAVAYRSDEPFTDEQRGELDDLLYEQGGEAPGSYQLFINEPDSGPSPFQVELLLSAVAVAFSVLVVAASLALAAAESREERDVLTVAGAPPGTLARTAGAKAGLLSVLGGVMAIPIGFLPVVVVSLAIEDGFPLRPPWATVVLLVAAVPIAAALIARLASSTAQHLRPVRVSTATFE
ncbi:MAG: hypothetical protein H0U89_10305 [Acidimicrobiia bacterium]|nr:hypothetical protein [Acidimicrobiia bacterium]